MYYMIKGLQVWAFTLNKVTNGTEENSCTFCKAIVKERKTKIMGTVGKEVNQRVLIVCSECMKTSKKDMECSKCESRNLLGLATGGEEVIKCLDCMHEE